MNLEAERQPRVTDPTGQCVAANVRRVRETRGWSIYQLSRALQQAGRPIAASAIAKVERAERRVDVGDLMALAASLKVNPSTLLLPFTDDPGDEAEITGIGRVRADTAWDWADGRQPIETIQHGDREGALMQFQLYARPACRRTRLSTPE